MLKVGSFVKIVGYAQGKDGVQVSDMEIVEVRHQPRYSLSYEKSYYILAHEGLQMDIRKKQESCPDSLKTVAQLEEDDWSRLHCTLHTIDRKKIGELERCVVDENVLEPGQQYMIKMNWLALEDANLPTAKIRPLPKVYHTRIIT